MEGSTSTSLPGCSGYYDPGKHSEIGNLGPVDNMGQDGGALCNLSSNTCLSVQLDEQFSYHPFSSLNLPEVKKMKPEMQMNSQGDHSVYQVNGNFELTRPIYDNGHHTWGSASGPCSVAMFSENQYHQVMQAILCAVYYWIVQCFYFCFYFYFYALKRIQIMSNYIIYTQLFILISNVVAC